MKKNLTFATIACVSLLSVTLFTGCSKSSDDGPEPPAATTTVFYRLSRENAAADELWQINDDGTNNHQINISLPNGWQLDDEDMAEVSNDGKTIVFLASAENTSKYAMYKCNVDGSNVQPILTNVDNGLALQGFINNNTVLFWQANSNYDYELYSVNLDGGNKKKINISLPEDISLGDEELAKVTSDGKTIVFLTQHKSTEAPSVYKCNIDGSNAALISAEAAGTSLALQDIAADNTILYRKGSNTSDDEELWAVNLDGSNKHKINIALTAGLSLQNEEMAKATADGNLVFSTTNANSEQAIYKAKLDGSGVTLISKIPSHYYVAIQSVKTIQ
ncbi:TolB family protein [Mucilaginibacter litoreus]|uniref:TolB family protein n=1 Tax=Mucilaginibacter litoreus TaxID=1048221 RepID=A0ABW3APC2_9SPHI